MLRSVDFSRVHIDGLCGKGTAPASTLGPLAALLISDDDVAPNYNSTMFEAAVQIAETMHIQKGDIVLALGTGDIAGLRKMLLPVIEREENQ